MVSKFTFVLIVALFAVSSVHADGNQSGMYAAYLCEETVGIPPDFVSIDSEFPNYDLAELYGVVEQRTGVVDNACYFGAGAYAYSAPLDYLSTDLSVCGFFNVTDIAGPVELATMSYGAEWYTLLVENGVLRFQMDSDSSRNIQTAYAYESEWMHVCLTLNTTVFEERQVIYIDGILANATDNPDLATTGSNTSTLQFGLGSNFETGGEFAVDELLVYGLIIVIIIRFMPEGLISLPRYIALLLRRLLRRE
jgi:hypothetical protein